MNFKELSKRERRFALEILWEVERALANDEPMELEERLSFDYDETACQEFLEDLLQEIKNNKAHSEKFFILKALLK